MPTVGVYLIYVAVVLRGVVRLDDMRYPGLVVALLALHGLLLLVETWLIQPKALPSSAPASRVRAWPPSADRLPFLYVLLQAGVVTGLLLNRQVQDFYALLFMGLSIQAVLLFGRRLGFLWITGFTLAMAGPLAAAQEGWFFGLVMVLNYGGLCFLTGGYAHQVGQAQRARGQNQRLVGELQVAYRQLQGYAAQVEDLAGEQERGRLARELHDSVTQTVFSMNLTVQSARLLLVRDPGRAAGQLERLEELAASAMGEIQALISQLRPTPVAQVAVEGLPAALRRLAAERQVRDGLEVVVEVNGKRALTEAVAEGLYRIAQEALTNVAKHAGTHQASVRLNLGGDLARLEIGDHGLGFDPQSALGQHGHLGLGGMAERAREIDWTLAVESQPGRGTRVRIEENPPGDVA